MPSDIDIPQSSYRSFGRSAGADPATRRLALIASGLGLALVVVVGGWMMAGHRQAGVPLIEADTHPIRVKPANPGGMQVIGANQDVMSSQSGDGQDNLAPAPEAPQIQALQAQIQAAKREEATVQPIPPPAHPAATPAAVAPVAAAAPAAGQAAAPPAPAAVAPPRQAGVQVQLAALASRQGAQTEWQRLSKRLPGLLDGHQPVIEQAAVDGKTMFRLRTGGFADMAAATAFCGHVRAKGAGCSVASF